MSKVPNGWAFSTVGDACTIRNNLRFPINSDERESIKGCFPYFGPTGILSFINDYKIDDNFALIGEDGDHFLKFKEKEMTLFFSGKANVNNHAHIICDSILCKARWFYFSFMHADITSHLTRQGAKRYKLTKASLEKLPILIPPLPEQIKIAEILSTWDNAINTMQKLLANSQQQKKALMQQLLTGKKRFVGFEEEWEEKRLDEISHIFMGSSPKSEFYNEDGIGLPLLQGNADIKNRKSVPRVFTSQITRECLPDDILLSVRAPVGAIASSNHHACIGRGIAAIRAKKDTAQLFLYQWLLNFEDKWDSFSQGSTFESVNSDDINNLKIKSPSFSEQQKIAAVLTTADQEIDNLRAQLNHLKQEKKALMQQLLTGKRRVKVAEAA